MLELLAAMLAAGVSLGACGAPSDDTAAANKLPALPRPRHPLAVSYPRTAQWLRQEGWVQLDITLGDAGRATDIRVIGSCPSGLFDHAAVRALQAARWTDPDLIIRPTKSVGHFTQTIRFRLDRRPSNPPASAPDRPHSSR